MLAKLHELEESLTRINKQYHVVATELANLKNKPDNEPMYTKTIEELKKQLQQSQNEYAAEKTNHQRTQAELDTQNQKIQELSEQNRQLTEENNTLHEKNRIASERAKSIQNWLQNIDQSKNTENTPHLES